MSSFTIIRSYSEISRRKAEILESFRKASIVTKILLAHFCLAKNYQARAKCDTELCENESALKELDLLKEDATVYKLIGLILVKQDLSEPNENVRMRISYLADELKRADAIIEDLEEKQMSKREKIGLANEGFDLSGLGRRTHSMSPFSLYSYLVSEFFVPEYVPSLATSY